MEIYGMNVFNDAVMKEKLPKAVYKQLKKTIDEGQALDPAIADVVANAMKDWAVEKGATHFTHWFQPMTNITAEKQEALIAPLDNGKALYEFSGKELIKGEPDASSFPSGGLRATFEARGYTAWDCTSPAFIRERALCIPTVFCSYTGEVLDKKTPLLKSIEAISKQSLRILKLFGNKTATRVISTIGPEQEYFLIDKNFCEKRMDLLLAGRTLFGAPSPKGQELEDHYFGSMKDRIAAFMHDLNTELWKLGISARTQHNEVSPAQFEIAPIFTTTNIGTDHNQLLMDTLKRVANRHGLVCLLHEKPFAGVNGSGKHLNWSLASNDGQNLLEPGTTPHQNAQFLTFLCAVIKAVDEYANLLRVSCANAGNDHRLGANEAPPAIISVFLGEQLTDIFEQLAQGGAKSSKEGGEMQIGVSTLPPFPKDATDRNRTSPFAFTGNKFEFRMVGSSFSISGPCIVLNTVVAEIVSRIADRLEKATDFTKELQKILKEIATEHQRVVFNGNNYDPAWITEAAKRGLPNITSAVEAFPELISEAAEKVLIKHGIFSKTELHSRYEIFVEQYCKTINIEALTSLNMAKRQILPAAVKYAADLAGSISAVKAAVAKADISAQEKTLLDVSSLLGSLKKEIIALEKANAAANGIEDIHYRSQAFRDQVGPAMAALRKSADGLEELVDDALWPLPTYAEMLFLL
ncbi:MAG: glutamine synthetase III [Clostridia bacterium]|jgi:glutamine synthetase|nr:glutamine synthetase III [Clostridia bacterium]